MSRFASVLALIALVAAPSLHARANFALPAPAVRLDPARMFDPNAESLLAALFTGPKNFSPVAIALYHAPNPQQLTIPAPVNVTPMGAAYVAAVALHAYAPPAQLPGHPLSAPSISPAAPALSHVQLLAAPPPAASGVHFGSYAPYRPALQGVSASVQVPVRVGSVHFAGVVNGNQTQIWHADAIRAMQLCGTTDEAAPCPYLHDESSQSIAAGTAFDVRAGNTKVSLQLSGTVGRVNSRDALYEYAPLNPDAQFNLTAGSPQDSTMLYYPGLSQIVRHGVGATLAVPVSPVISIGLQYDRSHYQGNYATLFAPGIDATKDTYLGNLTYQLPKSSSFFTLSARQYRYQDSFAPTFNLTETRADLTFTVKF
jgi:hypothetical protein